MSAHERHSRKATQPESTLNDDTIDETPIDFLYHNNTTALLKDAIDRLIENRPENPIEFLADFFSPSSDDRIESAYKKLSWCHYTKKAYQQNILEVYKTAMSVVNKDTFLNGLLAEEYNQLLHKIASDLPSEYVTICLQKLIVRKSQVVLFNRFYHDILLLHVMKDYVQIVHAIYRDLDLNNTGKASSSLCQDILESISDSHENRFMESLTKNMQNISLNSLDYNQSESMEERDFIRMAVNIFLEKI